MAMEANYAYRIALDLVTKGMESGSIKLHGVGNNPHNASSNGTADAAYIMALMKGLQAELPKD